MNLRQAAQQALEALKLAKPEVQLGEVDAALIALRAALAEPEQEPVALETVYETIIDWDENGGKRSRRELARRIVALYTTPPQHKPLSEDEIETINRYLPLLHMQAREGSVAVVFAEPQTTHWEGCEAVHPECKALAEPEQTPEGWIDETAEVPEHLWKEWSEGYTAPTPRKPLTDEEISVLWEGHIVPVFGKTGINPVVFTRAIERAHGIGEQQ
jgi:hypothetical protein